MSSCYFDSMEEYFENALAFLKKYQWIYKHRNVDILSEHVLSNFPKEWINYFNALSVDDLHDIVRGQVKECVPSDLKLLIDEINYLSPKVNSNKLGTGKLLSINSFGLSEKKAHEIALFAPVINEICQATGSDLIVDIGSGMGYLPHLLYDKYEYSILALEVSSKLINTARANQKILHPKSKGSVVFEQLFVSESSSGDISNYIEKHFTDKHKICLTGLHACADLSVDVLKLFLKLECANALVIMPCCYHRMAVVKDKPDKRHFKSFPSSILVKNMFHKYEAPLFLGQPFLRLACQQTFENFVSMSREEHQVHAQQCMYRAILQLVAETENCTVRRLKRKSGKSDATDSDEGFQHYLNNLDKTHELVGSGPEKQIQVTDEAFRLKMHEKWSEHKNDCWQVEALMGLQAAIQGICENVILLDRIEFLTEKGVHCYKRKITNDCISPRCWALIATKNVL